MTAVLIVLAAVVSAYAWAFGLELRYGSAVSPDQSIPEGLAVLAGWFVIAVAAVLALVFA